MFYSFYVKGRFFGYSSSKLVFPMDLTLNGMGLLWLILWDAPSPLFIYFLCIQWCFVSIFRVPHRICFCLQLTIIWMWLNDLCVQFSEVILFNLLFIHFNTFMVFNYVFNISDFNSIVLPCSFFWYFIIFVSNPLLWLWGGYWEYALG